MFPVSVLNALPFSVRITINGLHRKKDTGKAGHIPKALAEEVKRWVIEGPAEQGLDRANGSPQGRADHLLKTKGIRSSRSAVQRACAGIGMRLYRPTYRYLRGKPAEQAQVKEELADPGKGRRPVNSFC